MNLTKFAMYFSLLATSSACSALFSDPVYECGSQSDIGRAECGALVDLYQATNGPSWINNENWFNGAPCTWHGVSCFEGHVETLTLTENGLVGSMPDSISGLSRLRELWLDTNEISGAIPTGLGSLSYLEELHLDQNLLRGTIPESLGSISR